jgi:hypothetical protein
VINLKNIGWQARARWALFSSMFKSEWRLEDYPIRILFQPNAEPVQNSRRKPLAWTALVINWPGMLGSANSRLEALEDLRKNFDRFKATKPNLPRPGTKMPIELAAKERVDEHSELAKDFIKRVLDVEWAWISDESSLWDFHGDETNETLTDKIHRAYGVDVSDIPSGNLADIFDRIRDHRAVRQARD